MYGRRPFLVYRVHSCLVMPCMMRAMCVATPQEARAKCGANRTQWKTQTITPGYVDLIGSMIRKNAMEEIYFDPLLLCHTKLLNDTLRSVRSFLLRFSLCATPNALDVLTKSLERTKAKEGDKLERVSVNVPEDCFSAIAVETILRSRTNLQVLKLSRRFSFA